MIAFLLSYNQLERQSALTGQLCYTIGMKASRLEAHRHNRRWARGKNSSTGEPIREDEQIVSMKQKSLSNPKHYTLLEEILNSSTHGVGAGLSIAGLIWLILRAARIGDTLSIISVIVFGCSLILLYLASTLYHAFPCINVKRVFRVFDHCAIYLLIAGTYTPFLLVSMRGPVGWTFFGILWGIACVGCAFKAFFTGRFDKISTALYVAMGWIALVAIKPALTYIPLGALLMMAIGGLVYTSGVYFYHNHRIPFNHAIWHCFVMAGSAVHFFAILMYVLSTPIS